MRVKRRVWVILLAAFLLFQANLCVLAKEEGTVSEQPMEGRAPVTEAPVELEEFITAAGKAIPFAFEDTVENATVLLNDTPENTNPNYAYGVIANAQYSGSITTQGEVRWYAFDIAAVTKTSILVRNKPAAALDADIYLFQLDTGTMQLNSTGFSATNTGAEEYFTAVLNPGIYYFAIQGYAGSGEFILDFFGNAGYVDNEINDSVAAAQPIGLASDFTGGSVSGVIDTMRDYDYYKIYVAGNTPLLVNINFIGPGNNTVQYVRGDTDALFYADGNCILAPGTHYFVVYDTKGEFYIGNGTYTLSVNVITGNLTTNMAATSWAYYEKSDVLMQSTPDGYSHYINGTKISLNKTMQHVGSGDSWRISLSNKEGLAMKFLAAKLDYQSHAEDSRVTRAFLLEVGSASGDIEFGTHATRAWSQDTFSYMPVKYAVVAINAFDGGLVDVLEPDANPFDSYYPSW